MTTSWPIKASGADRWVHCPASPRLEAAYPWPQSEAASEGLAAHKVAELCLQSGQNAIDWAGKTVDGIVITAEVVNAVSVYLADVRANMKLCADPYLAIEYPVDVQYLGLRGKVDLVLYDRANLTTPPWIYDFKYGREYVDAEDNQQGLVYMIGLLQVFTAAPGFNFVIVQPRNYAPEGPVRPMWYPLADITAASLRIRQALDAAKTPDATAKCGPHCKWCRARHACPALTAEVHDWAEYAERPQAEEPTATQLGLELIMLDEAIDTLRARQTAMVAQAEARIAKGENIPGWCMMDSLGHEQWTVAPDAVFALGDMSGVELRKPAAAITPNQAIEAGMDKETVKALVTRERKGPALRRVDFKLERKLFA